MASVGGSTTPTGGSLRPGPTRLGLLSGYPPKPQGNTSPVPPGRVGFGSSVPSLEKGVAGKIRSQALRGVLTPVKSPMPTHITYSSYGPMIPDSRRAIGAWQGNVKRK